MHRVVSVTFNEHCPCIHAYVRIFIWGKDIAKVRYALKHRAWPIDSHMESRKPDLRRTLCHEKTRALRLLRTVHQPPHAKS